MVHGQLLRVCLTCGARAPVHPKQLHNFHLAAPAAPHTADIPNQVPTSLKLEKCQKDHLFSLPMWKRMLWIKQHCTLGHCISLMPFESGQSISFFSVLKCSNKYLMGSWLIIIYWETHIQHLGSEILAGAEWKSYKYFWTHLKEVAVIISQSPVSLASGQEKFRVIMKLCRIN